MSKILQKYYYKQLSAYIAAAVCMFLLSSGAIAKDISIAVLAPYGESHTYKAWQPTIDYLQTQIPEHQFKLLAIELSIKTKDKNKKTYDINERYKSLSDKEKQVFELLAQGGTNKIIANKLYVTQSTIEARRAKIITKMKANSTPELIKMGVLVGI